METSADFTLLDLHNFPDNTQPHLITVKYPELPRGQANKDGNQEPITIEVGMYELFWMDNTTIIRIRLSCDLKNNTDLRGTDNSLLDLYNSSDHTQPHSVTIAKYSKLEVPYRPFTWWRHFTTTTRIFQGFFYLCKLGLLIIKPPWEYQI